MHQRTRAAAAGLRRRVRGTIGERCVGRAVGDAGSMAVELAIVTPVVIVLLLTVVGLGRYSHGGIVVEQAAAAAARSASLTTTPGAATRAAQDTATATVAGAGLACASITTV